jgi:hypothetical protein
MKTHQSQFDEKLSKLTRNEACGLPKDAGMSKTKMSKGKEGEGKLELSDELREGIRQKWKQVVEPETGCATYDDLRKKLKVEETP